MRRPVHVSSLIAAAPLVTALLTLSASYGCNLLLDVSDYREVSGDAGAGADTGVDARADVGPPPGAFAGAWAEWVMPRNPGVIPGGARFSITSDNDILDEVTTRRWSMARPAPVATFEQANTACPEFYRLPTRIELVSLLDFSAADGDYLPNALSGSLTTYWTKSYVLPAPTDGQPFSFWMVDFATGQTVARQSGTKVTHSILCVRNAG